MSSSPLTVAALSSAMFNDRSVACARRATGVRMLEAGAVRAVVLDHQIEPRPDGEGDLVVGLERTDRERQVEAETPRLAPLG